MRNNISKYIIVFSLLGMMVSCKKFLEEKVVSQVSYQLYETEEGIEGALVAAYNTLRLGVYSEYMLTLNDAGTDLFTIGSDGNTAFNQYLATLSSQSGKLDNFWDYHYKGISECNVTIDYLPKVTMRESRKLEMQAEAKFLRALYYFDLVQQYGKIPLVLESYDQAKTDFKRAPVKDVYEAIISDLNFAFENLPAAKTTGGRAYKAAAAQLLAKVYLARGSAISGTQREIRGSLASDMDSVIRYSKMIVDQQLGAFSLVNDFAQLYNIQNQNNSEVIFAVQFTENVLDNADGNQQHLYHVPQYDAINTNIMKRSVEYGRPYRRLRPTPFVYNELFGDTRREDSRFMKSFVWGYIANAAANNVTTTAGNSINVKVGDTAIYFSPVFYNTNTELQNAIQENNRFAVYLPLNTYLPVSMNFIFPGLRKWLDPLRPTTNETRGSRNWVMMRYAETLLILAEAYGRKEDYGNAATYINMVRKRAAYKEGELKSTQYWTFEGGSYENRFASTEAEMEISATDLSGNFVDFILDERGREMIGELNRWEDLVRCEKLVERVKKYNPEAGNIRDFHILRPIPQSHIDRLSPRGPDSEEQNAGFY